MLFFSGLTRLAPLHQIRSTISAQLSLGVMPFAVEGLAYIGAIWKNEMHEAKMPSLLAVHRLWWYGNHCPGRFVAESGGLVFPL